MLESLVSQLREIQKERLELRSHKELTPVSLDAVVLSPNICDLWKSLQDYIGRDIYCYKSSDLEAIQPSTEKDEGQTEKEPSEIGEGEAEQEQPRIVSFDAPPTLPTSTYAAQFIQQVLPYFSGDNFSELPPALSISNKTLLYRTIQATEYLANNLGNFGAAGLSTLQKLRKIQDYMLEENTGSAMRLLKAARAADPHNNTLAYIFSQAEYFHANQGYTDALPDARSEAHKSGALNEALDPQTLLLYRYDAVCSERACGDKKAIEWLQEFYILDPEQTEGATGFSKHDALHLKSWLLLTTIRSQLWGDYVFNSIIGMTQNTIGGGALYLHLLRHNVMKEASDRAVAPTGVEELDKKISIAHAAYQEIKKAIRKWQGSGSASMPWTVRNRFLTDFYSVGQFPSFDEVLMNISLNGRNFEKRAFPTPALMDKGYDKEQYWRLWAIAIAPETAQKNCNILPFVETALEKDFYIEAEKFLSQLEREEQELIETDTWEEAEPHMAHLSMDHLLAASTRSDQPRRKFMPTVPPFSHYYRDWGAPLKTHPLPSVIIRQNASLGAFASSQEIYAALEGAQLLIKDPNYGIKAQQKQALEISQQKAKRPLFGGLTFGTNKRKPQQEAANIGQAIVYIFIPLLVVSFIVFFLIQLF